MHLTQFLSNTDRKKRILIVRSEEKGSLLKKSYALRTGEAVVNTECRTLEDIARKLCLLEAAALSQKPRECIQAGDCQVLFRTLLIKEAKNLKYFNNVKMFNIQTAGEIFRIVNLIRGNGWKDESRLPDTGSFADIRYLAKKYEEELEKQDLADNITMLRRASAFLDKADAEYIKMLAGDEIAPLNEDMELCSGIEEQFLRKLQLKVNGREIRVNLFGESPEIEDLSFEKENTAFFRGFGSANEAYYIAWDILRNRYALEDVLVLCSSSALFPYLRMALEGGGLDSCFAADYPAQMNGCANLAKIILDYARSGFAEADLEKIYADTHFSAPYEDVNEKGEGTCENAADGKAYFDFVLNVKNRRRGRFILSRGYERSIGFIKNERAENPLPDKTSAALDALEKLLLVFGDGTHAHEKVRVSELAKSLSEFIEGHAAMRSSKDRTDLAAFKAMAAGLKYDARELPLNEAIGEVKNHLDNITARDGDPERKIKISTLNDWTVIDRPYVYVIGLSLSDMEINGTESPVLSDRDMEIFVGDGYLPTFRSQPKLRWNNIIRTLMTFNGRKISFGYSDYNQEGNYETKPGNLYRKLLKEFSDIEDEAEIPEFIYGIPGALLPGSEGNPA